MKRTVSRAQLGVAVVAAAAILVAVPIGANAAAQIQQKVRNGMLIAGVKAPPPATGWQAYFTQNATTGANLLFTYSCPGSAPTPVSSSFSPTAPAKAGLQLIASYRPTTKKDSWTWEIHWPSGAPPNSAIKFNIYCVP